jgi:hypothetical protein
MLWRFHRPFTTGFLPRHPGTRCLDRSHRRNINIFYLAVLTFSRRSYSSIWSGHLDIFVQYDFLRPSLVNITPETSQISPVGLCLRPDILYPLHYSWYTNCACLGVLSNLWPCIYQLRVDPQYQRLCSTIILILRQPNPPLDSGIYYPRSCGLVCHSFYHTFSFHAKQKAIILCLAHQRHGCDTMATNSPLHRRH